MSSEPMDGSGHGIEFHYKGGEGHIVIGFIEGYAWQKGLSNQVRVYYLSPQSTEWGELQSRADDILNELRKYIYEVLEQKMPDKQRGNMSIWFNA
jgi:hypothetical protein